jgi:hypothetical protein
MLPTGYPDLLEESVYSRYPTPDNAGNGYFVSYLNTGILIYQQVIVMFCIMACPEIRIFRETLILALSGINRGICAPGYAVPLRITITAQVP